MNASHIAHTAVDRKSKGHDVTPATITADLVEQGCSPAQAATLTKMACALIPTVTAASLRQWRNAQAA